jgi:hypothetical protein
MDQLLDEINAKIDAQTVTCEDFNRLIAETVPECVRDRLRRRTIKNATKGHQDDAGHQQLQLPTFGDRLAPRRKPENQQNHGRSKIAHDHSTRTQRREFAEAVDYVIDNIGKEIIAEDLQQYDKEHIQEIATRLLLKPKSPGNWLYKLINMVNNE